MGSSSSRLKKTAVAKGRGGPHLILCGVRVCTDDTGTASKDGSVNDTVEDIMERRRSILSSYQLSKSGSESSDDSDGEELGGGYVTPTARGLRFGAQVRHTDNRDYGLRTNRRNPLLAHSSIDGESVDNDWDDTGSDDNDSEDGSSDSDSDSESAGENESMDEFGDDSGAGLLSASERVAPRGSKESDTPSDSDSCETESSDVEPVTLNKWHRPIYIPLSDSERAVVRQTRRQRQELSTGSFANQMARRGARKDCLTLITDLSEEPAVSRKGGTRSIGSDTDSSDGEGRGSDDDRGRRELPPLRRRRSSVRFTEAVVVCSAPPRW